MEPLSSYAGCTLATVLKTAPLDPLENRILLCHALRITRVQLITQSERRLDAANRRRSRPSMPVACAASRLPTSSASANSMDWIFASRRMC
jgi:hypothetical protein